MMRRPVSQRSDTDAAAAVYISGIVHDKYWIWRDEVFLALQSGTLAPAGLGRGRCARGARGVGRGAWPGVAGAPGRPSVTFVRSAGAGPAGVGRVGTQQAGTRLIPQGVIARWGRPRRTARRTVPAHGASLGSRAKTPRRQRHSLRAGAGDHARCAPDEWRVRRTGCTGPCKCTPAAGALAVLRLGSANGLRTD